MRRLLARVAVAAIVLLAGLPVTAQPVGVEGSVVVENGSVAVDLRAAGSGRVLLAVTHEDALLGTVVDRVVETNVSAQGDRLVLPDLRLGTNFTIRVFDANVTLPSLANVTRIIDGARLDELTSLVNLSVPAILPSSAGHARPFVAYPIGDYADFRTVVATREGAVVATSIGRDANNTEWLSAWTSLDGGHSYSASQPIVNFSTDNRNWAFAEIGDGDVAFLTREYNRTSWAVGEELEVEPWTLTRFDPIERRVVSRVDIGGDGRVRLGIANYDFAFLPDGDVLVGFSGSSEERAANGTVTRSHTLYDGYQLWRISESGEITFVTLLNRPENTGSPWRIAVAPNGAVALVAPQSSSSGASFSTGISYAMAPDGRTFGPWHSYMVEHGKDWAEFLSGAELDASGALLVSLTAVRFENGGGVESHPTLARLAAPGAPPTVLNLTKATATPKDGVVNARTPTLIVDGLRVWAFWFNQGDLWSIESVNGGVTYGPPTRLVQPGMEARYELPGEDGAAILPDGRPLLVLWSNGQLVSAPLYDPVPDASILNRLAPAAPPILRAELVGDAPILTPGRGAWITVRVHNTALYPITAQVEPVDASGALRSLPKTAYAPANGSTDVSVWIDANVSIHAGEFPDSNLTLVLNLHATNLVVPPLRVPVRIVPNPLTISAERDDIKLAPGESRLVELTVRGRTAEAWGPIFLDLGAGASGLNINSHWQGFHTDAFGVAKVNVSVEALRDAKPGEATLSVVARVGAHRVSLPFTLRAFIETLPPTPITTPTTTTPTMDPSATPIESTPTTPDSPQTTGAPTPSAPRTTDHAGPTPIVAAEPDANPNPETDDAAGPLPDAEEQFPAATVVVATTSGVAVGVIAIAAVATEAGRTAILLAAAALYTRLRKTNVLDHARRQTVYEAVRRAPGVRFEELRRSVGISYGALAYHLRVLQREGYLAARIDGARRRIYPSGLAPPSVEARAIGERIENLVAAKPGIAQADVARELGLSRQLASYHLDAVAKAGRVVVEREGRRVRYHPVKGGGVRVTFEPVR